MEAFRFLPELVREAAKECNPGYCVEAKKNEDELAQIILAHVAPCCGVNRDSVLAQCVRRFVNKAQVFGMAGATNHPAVKTKVEGLTLGDWYELNEALAQSTQTHAKETDINQ